MSSSKRPASSLDAAASSASASVSDASAPLQTASSPSKVPRLDHAQDASQASHAATTTVSLAEDPEGVESDPESYPRPTSRVNNERGITPSNMARHFHQLTSQDDEEFGDEASADEEDDESLDDDAEEDQPVMSEAKNAELLAARQARDLKLRQDQARAVEDFYVEQHAEAMCAHSDIINGAF